jgi:hypothetical protein
MQHEAASNADGAVWQTQSMLSLVEIRRAAVTSVNPNRAIEASLCIRRELKNGDYDRLQSHLWLHRATPRAIPGKEFLSGTGGRFR